MKNIILLILIYSSSALAVCSTPITRTPVGASSVLTATKYNSDVNVAYGRANNLPGDCIVDGTVTTSKLANGAVTTPKIANGAITSAKLAPDALPGIGRLIRISSFTSTGTWTKQSDVGFIYIQLSGGGGAAYGGGGGSGGTTSFGGHCFGYGGSAATSASGGISYGGAGGGATGGDVNLPGGAGGNGRTGSSTFAGGAPAGSSFLGHYGSGGVSLWGAGAGGGGGYCAKLIQASALNATEAVTIGAHGGSTAGTTLAGFPGIVFVYEYSK